METGATKELDNRPYVNIKCNIGTESLSIRFLIDTGSELTIIQKYRINHPIQGQTCKIMGVIGNKIAVVATSVLFL